MPYAFGRRTAVSQQFASQSEPIPYPAPVRGWISNQNLAQGDSLSCRIADNWFFTETGVRVRKGRQKYATVASSAAVTALFEYVSPAGARKFFAGNATEIMDITTVADADAKVSGAVTGQTSGDYDTVQFATTGGDYLIAVNGADDPQFFDGSAWSDTTFTITMPGGDSTTPSEFATIMSHQSRVWFGVKDSLDVYYSPVDAIGGQYARFTLKSVFERGGCLLFMASWSVDAGSGAEDRAVFVSSEGEVAIYTGINPSEAASWSLVGLYSIGKPAGRRAWFRTAGDLVIATEDGAIPLTQAIRRDPSELELSAVSRAIEPDWRMEFANRGSTSWSAMKWNAGTMAIFTLPHTVASPRMFVVNTETGAWAPWTDWDCQVVSTFGDNAYFGDSNGVVWRMEVGGYDGGTTLYTARLQYNATHGRTFGQYRQAKLARVIARSSVDLDPKISVAAQYEETFPSAPGAVYTGYVAAIYGTAVYGAAIYGDDSGGSSGSGQPTRTYGWQSVAATGDALAPQIQLTIGDVRSPDFELVSCELIVEAGAVVV